MPKYSYIAKSQKGETKKGLSTAKDESELARFLKQENLLLISAKVKTDAKKETFLKKISFLDRVSLTEKIMFTRNLQVMVSSGIALPRAMNILAKQTKNKKFSKTILDIERKIVKGIKFSESLRAYPSVFSELFISMIEVGEESGTLEQCLGTLTEQMVRQDELSSKIKSAMIYPLVIITAMLGIGFAMLLFVVPSIAATFDELNVSLPATTQFVIWLGNTMVSKWYLGLIIIGLLTAFFVRVGNTKKGKKAIGFLMLRIPVINVIVKNINSAKMARTLGSLISSGVPLTRSLEILSNVLGNVYYQEAMLDASVKIQKGIKLSDVLGTYQNIFPILVVQMIAVGEETGATVSILGKLADFFEKEVANATNNLAAIVEPLVMLLIGGAVGFFAISMVQPMYSMLGAIE